MRYTKCTNCGDIKDMGFDRKRSLDCKNILRDGVCGYELHELDKEEFLDKTTPEEDETVVEVDFQRRKIR